MKTAFITGANKSIGFETARQLAQKGYFVYLGCRDLEKGQRAVEQLKQEGLSKVEAVQIDVCDRNSIEAAKESLTSKISSLDLLINNAGIAGKVPQNASDTSSEEIRRVFDTNFFGTIDVTQAFLGLLGKAETPVIVNLSSGLASLTLHGDPEWMFYPYKGATYGPSKTAQNAYTVALAYEMRDKGFKINAVDPGFTATDFNQHRGQGTVVDAARFVVQYATLGADGPTGKYFSLESTAENHENPW
jgi:NAD(P)-dependent dehydrogenase (short-subunit alcohol dehydrogenase family)